MSASEEILKAIENRLREAKAEIETLARARAALDGQGSKRPTTAKRKVTKRASAPRGSERGAEDRVDADVKPSRDVSSGAPGPVAQNVRRPARRRARPKAGRAVEVVPAEKLELLLSETPGLTTVALAERANGARTQVLTLLRELEAAGRVRRTGQRRATRWHTITDEERIQARAAELAARSTSAT